MASLAENLMNLIKNLVFLACIIVVISHLPCGILRFAGMVALSMILVDVEQCKVLVWFSGVVLILSLVWVLYGFYDGSLFVLGEIWRSFSWPGDGNHHPVGPPL